ncbi:hypothetical protein C8J56DRAFT_1060547 [Mycena floridula]|nr:hypothetical protein C8J56DRAFT_1060547 [Mycena floridula]
MVQIAVASALTFAVVALSSTNTLAVPVSSEESGLEARQFPGPKHHHHHSPRLAARRAGKVHHGSRTEKAGVAVNAAGAAVDAANGIVNAVKGKRDLESIDLEARISKSLHDATRTPKSNWRDLVKVRGATIARRAPKAHHGSRTHKVGAAVDAAGVAVNVVNGIVAAKARRDIDDVELEARVIQRPGALLNTNAPLVKPHHHHQPSKISTLKLARRAGKAHHASRTSKTEKVGVAVNAADVAVDAANGIVNAVKGKRDLESIDLEARYAYGLGLNKQPHFRPGLAIARRAPKAHHGSRTSKTEKVGVAVDAAGVAVNVANGIVGAVKGKRSWEIEELD